MVIPYKNSPENKKTQVARMFNSIAPRYDFLNHLLSMGVDRLWRSRVVGLLKNLNNPVVLDVATGTGDLAIAIRKKVGGHVIGLDLSTEMLKVAGEKLEKAGIQDVELVAGDSENLPFEHSTFHAVTVAFGVRNFEHLEAGLLEMKRVLTPGGWLVILEFSKPSSFPMKQLYHFYFSFVLPLLGGLISKDKSAYTYLPESVNSFPQGAEFVGILDRIGMTHIQERRQTWGIATIYSCRKPEQ